MVFRILHRLVSPYLNQLVRVSNLPGRHRLRSSSSQQLLVPPFRLTTVGRRSFPVAVSLLWNSLPTDIQSSPSLPVFHQCLKIFLFRQSFPDFFIVTLLRLCGLRNSSAILATLKILIAIDTDID